MQPPAPASTLEYLAEREGLKGVARERFLRILEQSYGWKEKPKRRPVTWLGVIVVVGIVGGWFAVSEETKLCVRNLAWSVWVVGAMLLAGMGWRTARKKQNVSKATHWHVYCALMRPLIVAREPGLLDRNLPVSGSSPQILRVSWGDAVKQMMRERPPGFWEASLAGWCFGVLVLAIAGIENVGVLLGLPLVGMLVAPVAYVAWQCAALGWARKELREKAAAEE